MMPSLTAHGILIWINYWWGMEPGTYDLQTSCSGERIVATLAGFFSQSEVSAYASEAERLIRHGFARHRGYRMLIDVSDCAIQSQDVIEAFARHVAAVPRARRLAVVAGSAVARMQISRVLNRPGIELFDSLSDATAWLDIA